MIIYKNFPQFTAPNFKVNGRSSRLTNRNYQP